MTLLLDTTIRASLALLAGLSILPALRSCSASVRHSVLSASICVALLLPGLSALTPSWSLPQAATPAVVATATADGPGLVAVDVKERPVHSSWRDIGPIVQVVWAVGVLAGMTILLIGGIRLRRIAARAIPVRNGQWKDLSDEISATYRLRRPVLLFQSDRPSMLVTWGVWRPKLILPSGATEWPEDRVRVVLAHELAHVRRRDWLAQVAGEFLRCLYWFNPLLWIVCNRLRRESEQACDDAVINLGVNGSDYAAHLLELARILNQFDRALPAVLAMARPSTLERRFTAMLNPDLNRTAVSRSALLMVAIAFCAIALPLASFQVSAQTATGRLSGSVSDATGALIPGAIITMTNPQTRTRDLTSADVTGTFALPGLPPGQYSLRVSMPGFADAVTDITLLAGQDLRQNVRLNINSVASMITVTAPHPSPTPRITPPQRIRVGGYIQQARLTAQAKPMYPAVLRDAGIEGSVTLEGVVGTNGRILSLHVLSAEPRQEFVQAAMDAVSQWAYVPTLLNGEPVEVVTTVTVNFWLNQ